jgi:hypothetical protein
MPLFATATAVAEDNPSLAAFRKLKLMYGGELSEKIISTIILELRDIVPKGRYTSRRGTAPVCVSTLEAAARAKRVADISVVFTQVNRSDEQRLPIQEFLESYKFLATDCA